MRYRIDLSETRPSAGPSPTWRCVIVGDDDACVLDTAWLSLHAATRSAAQALGSLVIAALGAGTYRRPPGRRSDADGGLAWRGDLDDDCVATTGDVVAHAEWLSGPRRGGSWFAAVTTTGGDELFHSTAMLLVPRSGATARWLCELVVATYGAGRLPPEWRA